MPHGIEDSSSLLLRSDCSMCPPSSLRIIASIASLCKWRLTKIYVKTAILKTGEAQRDVYVFPPFESSDLDRHLWLLLTVTYGLENANAKWQVAFDQMRLDIGFLSLLALHQLFYLKSSSGEVTAALAKIIDDFLLCGVTHVVNDVVQKIS